MILTLLLFLVAVPLAGLAAIAIVIGISYVVNAIQTKDWDNE